MRSTLFTSVSKSWRYQNYAPLWASSPQSSKEQRRRGFAIVGLCLLVISLLYLGGSVPDVRNSDKRHQQGEIKPVSGSWTKPPGLTVVAHVFYGRRANVQILERYLRVSPTTLARVS